MQVFPPTEKIENINDQYWTLRAEEVALFLSLPLPNIHTHLYVVFIKYTF